MPKRVMLIAAALLLIYSCCVEVAGLTAKAQISEVVEQVWKNQVETHDLSEQVARDEKFMALMEEKIEKMAERDSSMEALAKSNNELLVGILGALLLLMIERGVFIAKQKAAK